MFKKKFLIFALVLTLEFCVGCKTLPPLPAANLSESGWKIQRGQAVWKPKRDTSEIAGELLVATNVTGNMFIQFTKTPFPIAIAQTTRDGWQIEFGAVNKRFSGRGKPWSRFIWFQLPEFLAGKKNSRQWTWQSLENNRWLLRNRITGESLEGFLAP
jgi:hypothetical protein